MRSHNRLGLASGWGDINKIRFNADGSLFSVAMVDGVRIFSSDPLREEIHLFQDRVGSVQHLELLENDNLCAMVPAKMGKSMWTTKNVLIMDPFDEEANPRPHVTPKYRPLPLPAKFLKKYTTPCDVLSVRIRDGHLAIVTRNMVYVSEFPGLCKFLFAIPTRDNPLGICELSPLGMSSSKLEILVFPGFKTGSVTIVNLKSNKEGNCSKAPVTINAHKSELQCIALNQQSSMIATASGKGTLIRIWDAAERQMLVELRRGTDQALLHCINFSSDNAWLCCSSDKGTVHIFALQDYKLNKRSSLATMGFVSGAYAGSQWSLASFTVPQECACVCAFGSETGTVFAACLDGSFHKYHFTADGKCDRIAYDVFTQMCWECKFPRMLASIRKNN